MALAEILDGVREKVEQRITELEPLVQEYEELMQFKASNFNGRSRARRGSTGTAAQTTTRRRQRSDGPNRSTQFLGILSEKGEASIPEVAKEVGDVTANYLYRVRDTLTSDGLIEAVGDTGKFKLTDAGKKHLSQAEGRG